MRCQFSGDNSDDVDVSLGSVLQNDEGIDENVSHRIRSG
jgi:hypothetical protein